MKIKKQARNSRNFRFFLYLSILVFLGLFFLFDTSSLYGLRFFNDQFYFIREQLISLFFGLVIFFVVQFINYRFWQKISPFLFLFSLILLFLIFIPGLGIKIYGAKRWINLGHITLQPSEFLKPFLILYFANLAEKKKKFLSYLIPLGLSLLFVILQPDLGTFLLIGFIGFSQMFAAGVNVRDLFLCGIGAFLLVLPLILLSPYRLARVKAFLSINTNFENTSYHFRQVLIALGSGGLWGVGFGQSKQKFLFLPEASTDSIFAVIAEETGFIGSSLLILLFFLLIYEGIKISLIVGDEFGRITVVGVTAWIAGQTFLNIGSMVGVIPLTGVPLPFISYGGSSLVSLLFASGIMLNIIRNGKNKKGG